MDFAKFLLNTDAKKLANEQDVLSHFELACEVEEDYIQLLQLRYLVSIEPFISTLNAIIDKIRNLPNDAERSRALPKIAEYIYYVSNKFESNMISSHIYAYFVTSYITKLGIPQDKVNWIDPRRYDLVDFSFSGNPPMFGYGGYQENRANFPDISGKLPFIKCDEKVITVPYGIKEIQRTAFDSAQNRRKSKVEFVTLPSSVEKIEEGAFARLTSLKYIVLPSNIKVIPQGMFLGCSSLKEVVAFGVTEIAPGAFSGTSIETLRGFNTKILEKVQGGAFANCTKLTSVLTPYTSYSAVFGGCVSLKELAYKAHPKVGMMKYLFMTSGNDLNPKCNVERVAVNFEDGIIPRGYFQDMISLKMIDIIGNISSIGEGAFMNCSNLQKINIKFTGNVIPANAFKGCKNLVGIPELKNVDTIQENAFEGVESLETLFLSSKVVSVGRYAFKDCKSLKNINFEYVGEVLPTGAFIGVSSIDISKLLPHIKVFEPYSAAGLTIPEGFSFSNDVKFIGSNAFLGCKFPEKFILTLSPNTSYEVEAFKDTNIKALFYNTLKIKDSTGAEIELYQLFTTSIDEFKRKYQIQSAIINIAEIPENGFKDWECLEFVGLAENTKLIGKRAFANCKNLKVIRNKAKNVSIEEEAFLNCSNLSYITDGNEPKEGDIDLNFASKIATGAFNGCNKFASIKAKDVELIYPTAFYGCSNITSVEVNLNKLVTSQGHKLYALFAKDLDSFNDGFKDLKEITVKFENNQIPESFFEGLRHITSITIDGDITLIGAKAFKDLPELENLSLHYVGEVMPSYCFSGTPKINALDFAQNITIFEPYSLSNLEFPTGYKLSPNLKRVMSHAFENSKFDEMFVLTFVSGATFEPLAFKGTNVSNLSLSSFEVKNADGNSLELYQIFEDSFEEFENNYMFKRVLIDTKEIPANAFKGWKNLQKVVCNENVKKIGDSAFEGCESIEAIKFKGKDVIVGDRAFYSCQKLKSFVTMNDTEENVINLDFTKQIGKEAFANCPSFTSIIAREVDYIDRLVFANSINIVDVHLKISDKFLDSGYKFYEIFTDSLEDFNTRFEKVDYIEVVVNDHITESFFEDLTSIYEITITGELKSIGKNCFRKATNVEGLYFNFVGEEIKEGTFEGLEKLETLPDMPNVSVIEEGAFRNCDNLREIHLSDKLISIGKYAFRNCQNLASINSEIFATKIEEETFKGCTGLCYVDLTNISEVGERAFEGVEGMTEIITGQIEGTIKEIFPDAHIMKASYIGKRIPARFYADLEDLEEVEFEDIVSIGAYAFDGCKSLKQISDISKAEYIGDNAFSGTSLEEIIIPKDIEYLGINIFENCSCLTKVSMPLVDKSLRDMFSIDEYEKSKEIKSFDGEDEFSYYIPASLTNIEITRFEVAGNFSGLDVDVSLLEELEDIPENFLKNYTGHINLNLKKVKHIGNYAFAGQEMNRIELPNIEVLDKYALQDIKGLNELSIGVNIKELPKEIFANPELVKVELVNNDRYEISDEIIYDKNEGQILFVNKDAYGEIHIKEYVRCIEPNTFSNCNLIDKIYTNKVEELKENAFAGLEDLTGLYIENPNCKVGEDVLVGSNKLLNIVIPSLEMDGVSLSLDYYLEKCDINHKMNIQILSGKLIPGFLGKINSVNRLDISSCDLKEIPIGLFKQLEIDVLYLPNDIDRISEKAFDKTDAKIIYSDALNIEDGVIYLQDKLIYVLNDTYQSLKIKEGTSLIYANAFEKTNSIDILDLSLVNDIILNRVFANYALKELIINEVNLDNEFASLDNSLTKLIYLGETFEYSLARFKSLKEIEFTNVKELDKNALAITNEVDVIRLPNIVAIKDYVFGNYDPSNKYITIKSLEIGPSINEIGQNALYNAYINKLVIKDSDKYMMFRGALIDKENKEILFVEKDSPTSFEYIEELENVHSYAFFGCKNLSNVVLKVVRNIGDKAFAGCDKLEKVIIGKPLETLGKGVFSKTSIDTLQIPFSGYQVDKPEPVRSYLFDDGASNLKYLYLSSQILFVENMFDGLRLDTLILPKEVEKFDEKVFFGLYLDHFIVPENVKELKSLTFIGMKNHNEKKISIYVPTSTSIENDRLIVKKVILFITKANIIKDNDLYQKQYQSDMQIRGFYENE